MIDKDLIGPHLAYSDLLALYTEWRLERPKPTARIAVMGSATTTYLVPLLEVFCWQRGIPCEIHESPFGTLFQQGLDTESAVYRVQPDIMVLLPHVCDLAFPPIDAGDPEPFLQRTLQDWRSVWQACKSCCSASILQGSYVIPPERPLGHLDAVWPVGRTRYLRTLNARLSDRLPPGVTLHDTEHLAGCVGKNVWCDPVWWHGAKVEPSFDAIAWLAHSLSASIASLLGRARKCLVLDLDDTLWGGVVADVGVEGIVLGGSAEGTARSELQQYILALRERGCVLAICSRNDPEVARLPFRQHPAMLLREEDIACFMASYDDKATSIRRIAEHLGLGLESMVFVDDNPAERELVRRELPDVAVVELPEDPSGYARALDEGRWFESFALTAEDLERTSLYRSEVQRRSLKTELLGGSTDLEGYLRSLEMTTTLAPLAPSDVARVTQLIGRTNQFNLTGRRLSEESVSACLTDPRRLALTARLKDRFGDLGLVATLLGEERENALWVDVFVMSCRVLSRGVEDALFAALVCSCRERRIDLIVGEYVPTDRNGLVREMYAKLGFLRDGGTYADGAVRWTYEVRGPVRHPPWMQVFGYDAPGDSRTSPAFPLPACEPGGRSSE